MTNLIAFPRSIAVSDMATTASTTDTAFGEKVVMCGGEVVLYLRPNFKHPVWQYRIRLPSGTWERKSTGTQLLEDAKRVAEARYQEVRWREARGLSERVVTFEQAAKEYVAHLRAQALMAGKGRTAEKQAGLIERYLIPHFSDTPLADVNSSAVTGFHQWYHEAWEKARSTKRTVYRPRDNRGRTYETPLAVQMPGNFVRKPGVNSRLSYEAMILAVIDFAMQNGRLSAGEKPTLKVTKAERRRRGAFTADEQRRLLGYLEQRITTVKQRHFQEARRLLWLWVRFHLLTGLRPGVEGCNLRFKDLEAKRGKTPHYLVRVREGKTGARTVVASSDLTDVIAAIRSQHPNPRPEAVLWIRPCGEHTSRFAETFIKVLRELGMERDDGGNDRTAYSLRHTYATNRLNARTGIDKLALNTGTSVQMIQNHYGHVLVEDHAAELTE